MKTVWEIGFFEYRRIVLRIEYWSMVLILPLWSLMFIGMVWMMSYFENDTTPIGYVDHSGVLQQALPAVLPSSHTYDPVPLRPFASEAQARAALDADEIRGYYVLPADYLDGGAVQVFYRKEIKEAGTKQFEAFVRTNLLADYPPEVARRALEGANMELRVLDTRTGQPLDGIMGRVLLPSATIFMLHIGVLFLGNYFLMIVVNEKTNRTLEILVSSVSPEMLLTGKVAGILGAGVTQVLIWLGAFLGTFLFFRERIASMSHFVVDWGLLWRIVMVFTPGFLMMCGLMAALGAILDDASEGRQFTFLITIPFMLPMLLLGALINAPDSPLSVGMSFFPLTAPVTMSIRLSVGEVPAGQFIASTGISWAFALGSLWLAGRVLRLSMMLYGWRLRIHEIWQDMLGRAEE